MVNKRKRVWIDRMQTILFFRIVLYFLIYQIAVWSLFSIHRSISFGVTALVGERANTYSFVVGVGFVVILGFLFIYDALQVTHRVVGPLVRFRKAMQAITAGEEVEPLRLRKGDHLQELKDEFNRMLEALEQRGAIRLQQPEAKEDQRQPTAV